MAPNWLGSTMPSLAGFRLSETTKSSAIFEREDLSEIGRSSFLGSVTCLILGRGVTSAISQASSSVCSPWEALRIFWTG